MVQIKGTRNSEHDCTRPQAGTVLVPFCWGGGQASPFSGGQGFSTGPPPGGAGGPLSAREGQESSFVQEKGNMLLVAVDVCISPDPVSSLFAQGSHFGGCNNFYANAPFRWIPGPQRSRSCAPKHFDQTCHSIWNSIVNCPMPDNRLEGNIN